MISIQSGNCILWITSQTVMTWQTILDLVPEWISFFFISYYLTGHMWKHYTRCYDHGTNDTRTEFCNCVLILPLNFFGPHRKRMWTIVFDLTPNYITLPHWAYAETLNFITLPYWTYVEILNFIIKISKERPRYHFIFDIYNFTTPINFFYNFGSNTTFAKQGLCQFHFYYNPILEFIWQNIICMKFIFFSMYYHFILFICLYVHLSGNCWKHIELYASTRC